MKYCKSKLNSKRKYYEVDKIIMRKIVKSKKYYLIKWEGYSLESCSWEPLSHLDKIIDLVEEFDNNFPDSIVQEDYQQFSLLYKRFQAKKMMNKTKIVRKKEDIIHKPNKFIINLDDLNDNQTNETKNEKENKVDILDDINSNIIKCNDEKEVINIANDGSNNNYDNMKLIRPIMV